MTLPEQLATGEPRTASYATSPVGPAQFNLVEAENVGLRLAAASVEAESALSGLGQSQGNAGDNQKLIDAAAATLLTSGRCDARCADAQPGCGRLEWPPGRRRHLLRLTRE